MMFDRRIVRGNTHAALPENPFNSFQGTTASTTPANRQNTRQTPNQQRVRQPNSRNRAYSGRRNTQSPQIEDYDPQEQELEEESLLEELPIPRETLEIEAELQRTESKPIIFIPKARGTDAETHIAQGDLYDYDLSVEPVLQTVIGRCLEQSLAEVLALKEQLFFQTQLNQFELQRQVGLATTKRMEAQCYRRSEEKRRRLNQDREMKVRDRVVAHKLSARSSAADFVGTLNIEVAQKLEEEGQFYNPLIQQIEGTFLPWLFTQVNSRLSQFGECRDTVDELILTAITAGVKDADKLADQKLKAEQRAKQAYDDKEVERERREEESQRLKVEAADKLKAQAAVEAQEGDY